MNTADTNALETIRKKIAEAETAIALVLKIAAIIEYLDDDYTTEVSGSVEDLDDIRRGLDDLRFRLYREHAELMRDVVKEKAVYVPLGGPIQIQVPPVTRGD